MFASGAHLLPVFTLGSVRPLLRERLREDRVEPHFFRRDLQLFGDGGLEPAFIGGAVHLESSAHFAPKALDLEFLGSQAARRGLQRVPCPVIRTGQALAVRDIGGCGKDGLAERRAGLAVQHDAHDVSAFGLGIVEGGSHDRIGQLALGHGRGIPPGDDLPLRVLLHQDDADSIAQPSGSAFVGFFFDRGVALGLRLYISPGKGGEHRASEQTDDQG